MEQHVPALPPRDYLDNEAFMKEWEAMTSQERGFTARRIGELKRGIAINKDKLMGRPKYALFGFYGLERADEDVYRLERIPKKAAELEEARLRAAKLRESLRRDEYEVEQHVQVSNELAEVGVYCSVHGLGDPAEYLRRARSIELAFYRAFAAREAGDGDAFTNEIMDGLCQLGDWIGFDPVQVLLDAYHGQRVVN
ncbi:hypothetical protein WI604_15895 [Bradyrhizobium symbiodeficiens]|uniref:hypothetical protein n=1 Tax=Bradyrhizobium symbiodeficiens TaxID=1404367 RepID=UPI0030CF5C08